MRFSIIDLGTNSVRMDIYEEMPGERLGVDGFRRIHREKVMVRLGDGLFLDGVLTEESMVRTLEAFDQFSSLLEKIKVDHVMAVATSAVRDAKNGNQFVSRILNQTGFEVEVISGEEEARLISSGIISRFERILPGYYALMDIGGGSTEVSICLKKKVISCASFPLGANRLQQVFLKSIPPESTKKKDSIKELRAYVRETVSPVISEREWPPVERVIGSSGTISALGRLLDTDQGEKLSFKQKELSALIKLMTPMTRKTLLMLDGMESKRVDLILAGAVLLDELVQLLGSKKVIHSKFSLRDGMFLEFSNKLKKRV